MISNISNLTVPFGTEISVVSPTFFPKSPFPIGESTEIFPLARSASLWATSLYDKTALFEVFFILTVDNTSTLELSSLDSSIILAFATVSSNLEISNSKRPWASFAVSYYAF